jgi:gas vesicle protein
MASGLMNNGNLQNKGVWIGIAVGAAVGIGIALSRRKRTRWDSARDISRRMADRSGDLADATQDLVARVKTIYEEGVKVVEDAGQLWSHGRRMVGY